MGLLAFLLLPFGLLATPEVLNFQGRAFDTEGEILLQDDVDIIIQLFDPSGDCLLYEEAHTVDTTLTAGFFSVPIGSGVQNTSSAPSFSFSNALSNTTPMNDSNMGCPGNNFTPTSNDDRRIRITLNGETLSPDQHLRAAPYSLNAKLAEDSEKLEGKRAEEFAQLDGTNVTQPRIDDFFNTAATLTTGESLRWDGSNWEVFTPGSASAVTGVSSSNFYLTVANGTTSPQITANVGTAANTLAAGDDSRFPNSSCASGSFMRWDGSNWQCETDTTTLSSMTGSADDISSGSTHLFISQAEKDKLSNIAANAEVNINADWNASSGDAQILNKPTIPDGHSLDSADGAPSDALVVDNDGNVGIGLSSPSAQLEVQGSALFNNGARKVGFGWVDNSQYHRIRSAGGANDGMTLELIDSTSAITIMPNNIRLRTNGSERVRIDPSGNVGVGTTTPEKALTIEANGAPRYLTDYSNFDGILLDSISPLSEHGIYSRSTFSPTGDAAILFRTNDWRDKEIGFFTSLSMNPGEIKERMTIGATGNVGIGSAHPGGRFVVNASPVVGPGTVDVTGNSVTGSGTLFLNQITVGAELELASGERRRVQTITSNTQLTVNYDFDNGYTGATYSYANRQLSLSAVGHLGIGTSSPATTMEVTDKTLDPTLRLTSPGGAAGPTLEFYKQSVPRSIAQIYAETGVSHDETKLVFRVSDNASLQERMVIGESGNVGIGTSSPSFPLEVGGIVHSSSGGFRLPDGTVIDQASDLGGSTDDVTIEISGGDLQVKDGGIGNSKLASGIDAAKITSGSLPVAQVPNLPASKINSGQIDNARLPTDVSVNKVTANTVELSNGIKIGSVGTTCDGSTEGTIRYNSGIKNIQFCDGTDWKSFGSSIQATLSIGNPSSPLVQSGPVDFTVTYGSGVDIATITLNSGDISIGGSATSGCSVSGITGSGSTRTVEIDGCSGTGTVNISVASGTADSLTGESAGTAGPSPDYSVDNSGPTTVGSLTLGSVPLSLDTSPTATYSAATEVGSSVIAEHQLKIERVSDSALIYDWTAHTSGDDITGLTLDPDTQYRIIVRAIDALGNTGTESSATWTSNNLVLTYTTGLTWRLDTTGLTDLFQNNGCTTPVTTNGDTIKCWKDSFGSNDAKASDSNFQLAQDAQGRQYVDTTDNRVLSFSNVGLRTIFLVMFETSPGIDRAPLVGHSSDYPFHRSDVNELAGGDVDSARLNGSSVDPTSTAPPLSAPGIVMMSTDQYVEINQLSQDRDFNSRIFDGGYYEIIAYDHVVSTANSRIIEGYLACKWDLQSELPGSHPYKSSCPSP